jgi:hypothetical protein
MRSKVTPMKEVATLVRHLEVVIALRARSLPPKQIDEVVAALDLIADEHARANKTLQMLQLEAKKQVVA